MVDIPQWLDWVIEAKGENWIGLYFRDIIFMRYDLSFLTNEENVLCSNNVILRHPTVPYIRTNIIQYLI